MLYVEGIYQAKAVGWGWIETTNHHDQFFMRFMILGVVDRTNLKAPATPCEPGTRTWSITLSSDGKGGNVEWLISTVQHLGYDGNDLLGLDPDWPGAHNFEGLIFLAQCKHEDYDGRAWEKWSVYRPSAQTRLPAERLKALNALYGDRVKAMTERRAAKTTANTDGQPGPERKSE
jgi:hypothetical protein